LSPLLANIALSVLDEHFAAAWQAMGDRSSARARRRSKGLATYRLVRYADDCAPRTRGGIDVEDRDRRVALCQRWRWALRDRPAGGGLKPPQGASVKSRGAERCGKGGQRSVRWEPRRRAEANHSVTRRKRIDDIETGESRCPGTSLAGACRLARRCPALRWRELGSGSGAERGNLIPDIGPAVHLTVWSPGRRERDPQAAETDEGQSSDAGFRGGPPRSSGEGPVMGLERRGRAVRVRSVVNHRHGGRSR